MMSPIHLTALPFEEDKGNGSTDGLTNYHLAGEHHMFVGTCS